MTEQTKNIGFTDAIRICLKEKYATFEGRASRSEYWYFYLFNLIISVIFQIATNLMAYVSESATTVVFILSIIYELVLFLPSMGVIFRRLHDIGKTGWYWLIIFIPIIGIILFIILLAKPSSPDDNKYGPALK